MHVCACVCDLYFKFHLYDLKKKKNSPVRHLGLCVCVTVSGGRKSYVLCCKAALQCKFVLISLPIDPKAITQTADCEKETKILCLQLR